MTNSKLGRQSAQGFHQGLGTGQIEWLRDCFLSTWFECLEERFLFKRGSSVSLPVCEISYPSAKNVNKTSETCLLTQVTVEDNINKKTCCMPGCPREAGTGID